MVIAITIDVGQNVEDGRYGFGGMVIRKSCIKMKPRSDPGDLMNHWRVVFKESKRRLVLQMPPIHPKVVKYQDHGVKHYSDKYPPVLKHGLLENPL